MTMKFCNIARRTAALLLMAVTLGAAAQAGRPIRLIVPSAAGAVPDTMMRLLAQEVTKETGQAFVIDNKPGASGLIGMSEFVRQPADGLTLGYVNNVTLAINRSLFTKLPYDPGKIAPVALLVKGGNVIVVTPKLPVNSLQELIAHARAHPNQVAYGSPGQGTSGHLSGELLAMKTGVKMRHVPYRGSPQAINDLLGGQFDMMIDNLPNVLPYIRQGKLKALAVTSLERNPQLPDVPTVAESGYPGFEAAPWAGLAMPVGTSEKVTREMNAAFLKAMQAPEMRRYLRDGGFDIAANPEPRALTEYAEAETVKWAAVIKQAGIQPQ